MNSEPKNQMVTTFSSLHEMERLAQAMARSNMFGIKTADQALTLMALAQAEGQHPATVARDYHVMRDGRPAKKAEAMQRDFLQAGGKIEWLKLTDEEVEATFSHPTGGTATISWDTARCKKAGLTDGNHAKFPRQMKRSRVVSEGVRTVWPLATSGFYVPEEVAEFSEPTAVVDTRSDLDAFGGGKLAEASRQKYQAEIDSFGDVPTPPNMLHAEQLDRAARAAAWDGVDHFRKFVGSLSRDDRAILNGKVGTKEAPGELLRLAIEADAMKAQADAEAASDPSEKDRKNLVVELEYPPSDNELLAWARKVNELIKDGYLWEGISEANADTISRMRDLDPNFDKWIQEHISGP